MIPVTAEAAPMSAQPTTIVLKAGASPQGAVCSTNASMPFQGNASMNLNNAVHHARIAGRPTTPKMAHALMAFVRLRPVLRGIV